MKTFNELLIEQSIDPVDVIILRHTGKKGRLSLTPHELWCRQNGSFERYQSTQLAGRPIFSAPIWASFVSDSHNRTLFVGLYDAQLGNSDEIDWNCPMSGLAPGVDKGVEADLYHLALREELAALRGELRIEWDKGYVGWVRRARRSNFIVSAHHS